MFEGPPDGTGYRPPTVLTGCAAVVLFAVCWVVRLVVLHFIE